MWVADNRLLRPKSSERIPVDLLIGSDYYWQIVEPEIRSSGCGLTAVASKFGWLIHGSTTGQINKSKADLTCLLSESDSDPEPKRPSVRGLNTFWDLEHLGIHDAAEDVHAPVFVTQYQESITRADDGRYIAPLPRKDNISDLPSNLSLARGQLNRLLAKLKAQPELLFAYHQQIESYLASGFIARIDIADRAGCTYLPHRPVVREDKTTTKIRPVFNASARTKGGLSLNDCLEVGPNLNPDLFTTLVRFRLPTIALIADIEKAFLQILLTEEDSDLVRFLLGYGHIHQPSSRCCLSLVTTTIRTNV